MDDMNQSDIITVQNENDDYFEDEEIQKIMVGTSSIIGHRKMQQDTIFGQFDENGGIGIVCDGMGGLEGGEKASALAARTLAEDYFNSVPISNVPAFFRREGQKIDGIVSRLTDERGNDMDAGTTMVAAIIQDDILHFLSIGDSRIFFIRNDAIQPLNELHNYRLTMDRMLKEGSMSMAEYKKKGKQAEALISFLGMGDMALMDIKTIQLKDQDRILLCSDGLYRALSEKVILEVLNYHKFDMQMAAQALTDEASRRSKRGQDNTSVVLIQYNNLSF